MRTMTYRPLRSLLKTLDFCSLWAVNVQTKHKLDVKGIDLKKANCNIQKLTFWMKAKIKDEELANIQAEFIENRRTKNKDIKNTHYIKADFESVLCTLESLFTNSCFVSCKRSKNVAFRIYVHEVNSKFPVNCHNRCEALCFILSDITWWKTFIAVKLKETVGKRI